MAVRDIIRMGHPLLATSAEPVREENIGELASLINDMLDTMRAAEGVGLAAPQIGISMRVIVFEDPDNKIVGGDITTSTSPHVLINPEINITNEEQELGWEGCLSIPGLRGEVPRYTFIEYHALDLEGNTIVREANGFHARVVQHEVDHLNGILYPERMINMRQFGFVKELSDNIEHKLLKK
ncbi:MAG: peptide deformylase [Rhodospirillaceae bacterium]|nr:peptide deformylase [Rhodospirillaceae bacterium]|tara:strand:- start:3927 stop:4472 length:546 start_codon:yes stop_codon:yes gene_type:complete